MNRDEERVQRIQAALSDHRLDAIACHLPGDVLLLSGYWPVIGISVALVTRQGEVRLVVPEDERGLAEQGWANQVHTFSAGSLRDLRPVSELLARALQEVGEQVLHGPSRLGFENGEQSVPAAYVATHVFGPAIQPVLQAAFPSATLEPASEMLDHLRTTLTAGEIPRVVKACAIAEKAFEGGVTNIHAGAHEPEIASAFRCFLEQIQNVPGIARSGGAAWCMSGPNSADASGAYARTRDRAIEPGDLVLVHCNSYVDGFWTDITRTFCLGEPDARKARMYSAVLEASQAAFAAVKPGATGASVDRAARDTLRAHGFGEQFKHGTGHGVGFGAISHQARPRLHPASTDVLETGMVFNIEPAIYVTGFGGLRHCSMVVLGERGPELLTPFQSSVNSLVR